MLTKPRGSLPSRALLAVLTLSALFVTGQSLPTTQPAAEIEVKTIAHIRVSGLVRQSPPDMSLFGETNHTTLADWLKRLARARNDDKIDAVALEIGDPTLRWSQAQELADAVERLNKIKPVYAYLQNAGFAQYLIASKATEIAMEPSGELWIIGMGAELMFFRGTLNKLKLTPQMVQVGRFKGAAEPFTDTGPSKETIQSYDRILDDLFRQMYTSIATARKLKPEAVKATIDQAPLSAEDAVKAGFVDRQIEKIEWRDHVMEKTGATVLVDHYARKTAPSADISNPFALLALIMGARKDDVKDPSIAIIHAEGMILPGRSGQQLFGQQTAGAGTLMRCFKEAADDDRIKAVVFRIDSPGGSAAASELIYQAVRQCASDKPVIVSVSSMAASGGYYIAAGGVKIIADESAIIGSIGVISGKIANDRFMEWIGITRHEITRGANAGLRMSRPWDKRELALIRKQAQRWYETFTSRVKESRKDRVKDIEKVAQGRIFTAPQAIENGLIDGIGGLNDAIEMAKKAVGIKKCSYVTMPRPRTLADLFSPQPDTDASAWPPLKLDPSSELLTSVIGRSRGLAYLVNLAQLMTGDSVLAATPYYLEIKP